MKFPVFDLHCDTAFRMLKESQPLWNNQFSVSLESAEKFKHYTQVMALWTDDHLDDESGWSQMLAMRQHLINDVAILKGCAKISVRYTDTEVPQLFLSVEDARILAGGTAAITDAGMTGADASVLGRAIPDVLKKFSTGMPCRLPVVESGSIRMDGVVVTFDHLTGRASAIESFSRRFEIE